MENVESLVNGALDRLQRTQTMCLVKHGWATDVANGMPSSRPLGLSVSASHSFVDL